MAVFQTPFTYTLCLVRSFLHALADHLSIQHHEIYIAFLHNTCRCWCRTWGSILMHRSLGWHRFPAGHAQSPNVSLWRWMVLFLQPSSSQVRNVTLLPSTVSYSLDAGASGNSPPLLPSEYRCNFTWWQDWLSPFLLHLSETKGIHYEHT
jgi:hypothetical protein